MKRSSERAVDAMAARWTFEQLAADSLTMTGAAIAKKYGFSERRYYQLKARPEFEQARAKAAADAYGEAMNMARQYALEAVETLRGVMVDQSAAAGARAQAAAQMVAIATQMQEQAVIMARLDELEAADDGAAV